MEHSYLRETYTDAVERLSAYESFKEVYHRHQPGVPFPSNDKLRRIVDLTRTILFPGYFGDSEIDLATMKYHIGVNLETLMSMLEQEVFAGLSFSVQGESVDLAQTRRRSGEIVMEFVNSLPELREILITDVKAAYDGDPAAKSFAEILLCYPCARAVSSHRIAHKLLTLGVPFIPRMISELSHSDTGIDIHPGASIGSYFTIDHGTGVVVGETAILGNHVKLYQGVTLGAKSFQMDENGNPVKNVPRHPILKDNVVVYANATILGRITIGEGAIIGGNVWVTHDVPDGGRVVQPKSYGNRAI